MTQTRALTAREDSAPSAAICPTSNRVAQETIPCEGCGDTAPRRLREFEIHIVGELYAEYWLCDSCLETAGVGRVDPPFFCGFLTGYQRVGMDIEAPGDDVCDESQHNRG